MKHALLPVDVMVPSMPNGTCCAFVLMFCVSIRAADADVILPTERTAATPSMIRIQLADALRDKGLLTETIRRSQAMMKQVDEKLDEVNAQITIHETSTSTIGKRNLQLERAYVERARLTRTRQVPAAQFFDAQQRLEKCEADIVRLRVAATKALESRPAVSEKPAEVFQAARPAEPIRARTQIVLKNGTSLNGRILSTATEPNIVFLDTAGVKHYFSTDDVKERTELKLEPDEE